MARRYHRLPSEILRLDPEEMAVNLAIYEASIEREVRAAKRLIKDGGAFPVVTVGGV